MMEAFESRTIAEWKAIHSQLTGSLQGATTSLTENPQEAHKSDLIRTDLENALKQAVEATHLLSDQTKAIRELTRSLITCAHSLPTALPDPIDLLDSMPFEDFRIHSKSLLLNLYTQWAAMQSSKVELSEQMRQRIRLRLETDKKAKIKLKENMTVTGAELCEALLVAGLNLTGNDFAQYVAEILKYRITLLRHCSEIWKETSDASAAACLVLLRTSALALADTLDETDDYVEALMKRAAVNLPSVNRHACTSTISSQRSLKDMLTSNCLKLHEDEAHNYSLSVCDLRCLKESWRNTEEIASLKVQLRNEIDTAAALLEAAPTARKTGVLPLGSKDFVSWILLIGMIKMQGTATDTTFRVPSLTTTEIASLQVLESCYDASSMQELSEFILSHGSTSIQKMRTIVEELLYDVDLAGMEIVENALGSAKQLSIDAMLTPIVREIVEDACNNETTFDTVLARYNAAYYATKNLLGFTAFRRTFEAKVIAALRGTDPKLLCPEPCFYVIAAEVDGSEGSDDLKRHVVSSLRTYVEQSENSEPEKSEYTTRILKSCVEGETLPSRFLEDGWDIVIRALGTGDIEQVISIDVLYETVFTSFVKIYPESLTSHPIFESSEWVHCLKATAIDWCNRCSRVYSNSNPIIADEAAQLTEAFLGKPTRVDAKRLAIFYPLVQLPEAKIMTADRPVQQESNKYDHEPPLITLPKPRVIRLEAKKPLSDLENAEEGPMNKTPLGLSSSASMIGSGPFSFKGLLEAARRYAK